MEANIEKPGLNKISAGTELTLHFKKRNSELISQGAQLSSKLSVLGAGPDCLCTVDE